MEENSSEVMSAITDSDIIANLKSINIDKIQLIYYAKWYQGKELYVNHFLWILYVQEHIAWFYNCSY